MRKSITVLMLVIVNSFYSYAQRFDELLFNFETSNSLIEIDTSNKDNIWQIGKPSKPNFNSSYSGQLALITDSISYYPINNNSSFQINISSEYVNTQRTILSFWHKFDTDTINDFGFIEYSFDGGINWAILNDTNFYNCCGEGEGFWQHWDSSKVHSWSGNMPFTGSSSGWIYSEYLWIWYLPLIIDNINNNTDIGVKNTDIYVDNILLRFSFISDAIAENKSGWMIDDINIREDGIDKIADYEIPQIDIFPNPATEFLTIHLEDINSIKKYEFCNFNGQLLQENKIRYNQFDLNLSAYNSGVYLLKLISYDNMVINRKVILK